MSYVYDSANQLIRENNPAAGKTWIWSYDDAGNILSRTEYAYTTGELGEALDTVVYTYGDSDWGDLLTSYDGNTITYDGIGNPLSDGTWTYSWEHGRELSSMSDGTTTWTYTYDANGMRTGRTNGSTSYSYVYNGNRLTQMTIGTDTLNFIYDASGVPVAFIINNITVFYYVTSLQGDVQKIVNTSGNVFVSYEYDAWSNILSITGTYADSLGILNPLTYRGYVYDHDTGLYYLQSRYYDPEVGRFLNADSYVSTGGLLGYNVFTYCLNNPICRVDRKGTISKAANLTQFCADGIGTAFGALIALDILNAVSNDRVLTDQDVAIMDAFVARKQAQAKEKENVVVVADTIKESQNVAVYYGYDLYGGTMNCITGPMTFQEADMWVTATAVKNLYPDRASWGLYTQNISDAAAMAVYLGCPDAIFADTITLFPDIAKSPRHYSHFHTSGRTVHGISANNFHIWYGNAGG